MIETSLIIVQMITSRLLVLFCWVLIHCRLAEPELNDDFCDTGNDEPGTSACSHLAKAPMFQCQDTRGLASIFSSRVDDTVCDCCDGSDEGRGACANTCDAVGEEMARAAEHRRRHAELGQALKKEIWEHALGALHDMRSAMGKREEQLPGLTALREAALERFTQEKTQEAAELEQRVIMATMLFEEAVTTKLGSVVDRQDRMRLIATLALRGKEMGAEAVLGASAGKYVHPGEDVDDTEAIVLAMDSPDDIDAALLTQGADASASNAPLPPPVISLDLVEAMMQALALQRLSDDGLLEVLGAALGVASQMKVAGLAARDAGLGHVLTVEVLGAFPPSPQQVRLRGHTRAEAIVVAEQLRDIEKRLAEIQTSSAEAEEAARRDFGPNDVLFPLYHAKRCFSYREGQYLYTVCPYGEAKQQHTLLGTHAAGERLLLSADGGQVQAMSFSHGERCRGTSDQRERVLFLRFQCDGESSPEDMGRLSEVFESEVCIYHATLLTPLVC